VGSSVAWDCGSPVYFLSVLTYQRTVDIMTDQKSDPMMGSPAPEFCLPDAEGEEYCLTDFAGKWLVLYFYPRDNTPGCTLEARGFSEAIEEFARLGAEIVGVSADSEASHQKFTAKLGSASVFSPTRSMRPLRHTRYGKTTSSSKGSNGARSSYLPEAPSPRYGGR